MSVGLGGKIDGADQGDKANGETRKDGREENACKAFSKDLIVRAIGSLPRPLQRTTLYTHLCLTKNF